MTFIKKYGSEVLEVFIIILLLYMFFYPAKVDGKSMEDTLYDGDIIMMSRAMAFAHMYDKDDIIVFDYDTKDGKKMLIKRIAAVEGDYVESKEGKLYINGEEIKGYMCEEDFSLKIDDGYVFVLGDNPDESTDSRDFGQILTKDIAARAIIRVWPLGQFESLL